MELNSDNNGYGRHRDSATVICQTEYGMVMTTVRDLFLDPEEEFRRANSLPTEMTFPHNLIPAGQITHLVRNHFSYEQGEAGTSANTGCKKYAVLAKQTLTPEKETNRKSRDVFYGIGNDPRRIQSTLTKLEPKQFDIDIVTEFLTTKHSRTPVFSGSKNIMKMEAKTEITCLQDSSVISQIPKLSDISGKIVQRYGERLVGFEKLPTLMLLNFLSKVSVKHLRMIERHNPGILEKTDQVWKMKFSRDFRSMDAPAGDVLSWRDIYQNAEYTRKALLNKSAKSVPSVKASSRPKSTLVDGTIKIKSETTKIKVTATKHKLTLDDHGFLAAFDAGKEQDELTMTSEKRKRIPVAEVLPVPQPPVETKPKLTLAFADASRKTFMK